jgi:hypothetical protein
MVILDQFRAKTGGVPRGEPVKVWTRGGPRKRRLALPAPSVRPGSRSIWTGIPDRV